MSNKTTEYEIGYFLCVDACHTPLWVFACYRTYVSDISYQWIPLHFVMISVGSSHHQALFWDGWVNLDWIGLLLLLLLLLPHSTLEILFWHSTFTGRLDFLCTCHREGYRNIVPKFFLLLDFITDLYYTYILHYIFSILTFIGILITEILTYIHTVSSPSHQSDFSLFRSYYRDLI